MPFEPLRPTHVAPAGVKSLARRALTTGRAGSAGSAGLPVHPVVWAVGVAGDVDTAGARRAAAAASPLDPRSAVLAVVGLLTAGASHAAVPADAELRPSPPPATLQSVGPGLPAAPLAAFAGVLPPLPSVPAPPSPAVARVLTRATSEPPVARMPYAFFSVPRVPLSVRSWSTTFVAPSSSIASGAPLTDEAGLAVPPHEPAT